MNREIKFRVWAQDKIVSLGEAIQEGIVVIEGDGKDSSYIINLFKSCSIMQYTGLKDKNGVEIYEGDIIESSKMYKHVISYCDYEAKFIARSIKCLNDEVNYCSLNKLWIENCGKIVIGNIYENPELLEGKG